MCAALRPLPPPLLRAASARLHLRSAALCTNGAQARERGATGGAFRFISVCCLSAARRSHPRRCAHARCRMQTRLRRGSGAGARRGRRARALMHHLLLLHLRAVLLRAAPLARADTALRGSRAECRVAPRRAASVLACAAATRAYTWRACAMAPLTPSSLPN
jgi:hypothetical protein